MVTALALTPLFAGAQCPFTFLLNRGLGSARDVRAGWAPEGEKRRRTTACRRAPTDSLIAVHCHGIHDRCQCTNASPINRCVGALTTWPQRARTAPRLHGAPLSAVPEWAHSRVPFLPLIMAARRTRSNFNETVMSHFHPLKTSTCSLRYS